MQKLLATTLLVLFCTSLKAQTDAVLDEYLKNNKYVIKVNPDQTTSFTDDKLPKMLDERMKGKVLFVYGEGFSHNLHANGYLENMFIAHFAGKRLKYVFGEQARSWVVKDDLYYKDPKVKVDDFFTNLRPGIPQMREAFKATYQNGHFEFKAVDFERASSFRETLQLLTERVNTASRAELAKLMPYIDDTSYITLSPGKFVSFLKDQRDQFNKDSNRIKELSGDMYAGYHYLLTDPEPSQYADNRNKNMANHVLWQMGTPEPGAIYMETCGLSHARRKGDLLQKSTVGYLEASDALKGKLLIASVYCENCTPEPTKYGIGDNSYFKYMKDDVLRSFQQALGSDEMVLFDLTNLPEKYQYMRKDYVDILVFARNSK